MARQIVASSGGRKFRTPLNWTYSKVIKNNGRSVLTSHTFHSRYSRQYALTNNIGPNGGPKNGSDDDGFPRRINGMEDGGFGNFLYGGELDERPPHQF
jgi:hypothetical protein